MVMRKKLVQEHEILSMNPYCGASTSYGFPFSTSLITIARAAQSFPPYYQELLNDLFNNAIVPGIATGVTEESSIFIPFPNPADEPIMSLLMIEDLKEIIKSPVTTSEEKAKAVEVLETLAHENGYSSSQTFYEETITKAKEAYLEVYRKQVEREQDACRERVAQTTQALNDKNLSKRQRYRQKEKIQQQTSPTESPENKFNRLFEQYKVETRTTYRGVLAILNTIIKHHEIHTIKGCMRGSHLALLDEEQGTGMTLVRRHGASDLTYAPHEVNSTIQGFLKAFVKDIL